MERKEAWASVGVGVNGWEEGRARATLVMDLEYVRHTKGKLELEHVDCSLTPSKPPS